MSYNLLSLILLQLCQIPFDFHFHCMSFYPLFLTFGHSDHLDLSHKHQGRLIFKSG